MVTLTQAQFEVLLRIPGWEFNEDVRIHQPTARRLKDSPDQVTGSFYRVGTFTPGFLNEETGDYEPIMVQYEQPFTFSRYDPMGTLDISTYDKALKRWTFGNVQVLKTANGPARFCRTATLEPLLPDFFKEVDYDGLLDSIAFDEVAAIPKPEDFEENQTLRDLVKDTGMSRPEIARRIGVNLHTLHNYLAQPHHQKYNRCPLWVIDRVGKLAKKREI